MPLIQIPQTGKTIYISSYEYFFALKEEDIDAFFQSCAADDLGIFQEDPFAERATMGKLEIDDENIPLEDIPEEEIPFENPDEDL